MEQLKIKLLMGPSESRNENFQLTCIEFLSKLGEKLGREMICADMEEVSKQPLPIYFVASGGAEGGFVNCYTQTKEPYILLSTQEHNSLAASMEIMGYLQEQGLRGEIIHGSFEVMAKRLKVFLRVAEAKRKLNGMKLGCFGMPDGLVASGANFSAFSTACKAEVFMIDTKELLQEYQRGGYCENIYTESLKRKNFDRGEIERALNVYGALKRLIERYGLDGLTVKCFDLLDKVHTTGCLALAILNAEGIPAACEGDQKSMISMAVLHALTGQSGFMAHPDSLDDDKDEIIFAHCTLPLDMPEHYELMSHFESESSVAVSGDLKPQKLTVFKCNDTLEKFYVDGAELLETMHKSGLCRTQMRMRLEKGVEYFLRHPISNHHIICKGDWKDVIEEYFA